MRKSELRDKHLYENWQLWLWSLGCICLGIVITLIFFTIALDGYVCGEVCLTSEHFKVLLNKSGYI